MVLYHMNNLLLQLFNTTMSNSGLTALTAANRSDYQLNNVSNYESTFTSEGSANCTYERSLNLRWKFWVLVVMLPIICLLGNIGNLLAILVLLQKRLRGNLWNLKTYF